MAIFFVEITGEDRLAIGTRIQNNQMTGIRVKRQVYQRSDRVVTDIKGFEPFNTGEWLTLVKYDNWKGEAVKDSLRPTPASFSPLGIHVKENWGFLDVYALIDRVFSDLKDKWETDYINYGGLAELEEKRKDHFQRNLPFVAKLVNYILNDFTILEQLRAEQAIMPMPQPGQDDWLIEVNAEAMNRVEKVALRGRLSIENLGTEQIITHHPRAEGEDVVSKQNIL